jgi:hypothetical protein
MELRQPSGFAVPALSTLFKHPFIHAIKQVCLIRLFVRGKSAAFMSVVAGLYLFLGGR